MSKAAAELDLETVRADEISEPGQINLQVVDHVLGARAAVADLTGLNPNVFYELAIRHTARLTVVLIAEKGSALPFDIAQMRTIFVDHNDLASADNCREQIVAQLREALANGSVNSPIATSVDVRAMQSGSVVERNVAELVTTVEGLSRLLQHTLERSADGTSDELNRRLVEDLAARWERVDRVAQHLDDPELTSRVEALWLPIRHLAEMRSHLTRPTQSHSLTTRTLPGDEKPRVRAEASEVLRAPDAERAMERNVRAKQTAQGRREVDRMMRAGRATPLARDKDDPMVDSLSVG